MTGRCGSLFSPHRGYFREVVISVYKLAILGNATPDQRAILEAT